MHIDREDMLELTRRMTVSRNCFSRIAGCNTFHAFLKKESVSVFVFVSSIIFPSLIVTVI